MVGSGQSCSSSTNAALMTEMLRGEKKSTCFAKFEYRAQEPILFLCLEPWIMPNPCNATANELAEEVERIA